MHDFAILEGVASSDLPVWWDPSLPVAFLPEEIAEVMARKAVPMDGAQQPGVDSENQGPHEDETNGRSVKRKKVHVSSDCI